LNRSLIFTHITSIKLIQSNVTYTEINCYFFAN